jgi:N-acetylmuramic acid 6-phosphate etherase
MANFH